MLLYKTRIFKSIFYYIYVPNIRLLFIINCYVYTCILLYIYAIFTSNNNNNKSNKN